jgi:hypothetical protein
MGDALNVEPGPLPRGVAAWDRLHAEYRSRRIDGELADDDGDLIGVREHDLFGQ